jgi:large subunit ribosomal protein L24
MTKAVYKIRITKGDTVMIRSGKFKGRTGKVTAVHPTINKVTIEGINIVKRHRKPTQQNPQGGITEITKPIWTSKVGILDAAAKKPSKVMFKIGQSGKKTRIIKSSNKEIK